MFFRKTGIFSSFISFSREVPSPVSLQAITNVLLLRARKDALEDLYQKNQKYERLGRLVTEELLIDFMLCYILLSFKTSERYISLLQERGKEEMKNISLKNISSFLRIEPESLTRIRRQLKKGSTA